MKNKDTNKVVACSLLLIGFINGIKGMDEDPAEIIRVNIEHPSKVMEDLSRLSVGDLAYYRDLESNNLFHIMVKALIAKQDKSNYGELQRGAGDLIFYLQQKGVEISGFNDDSKTPLLLLYYADGHTLPHHIDDLAKKAPVTHKHDILKDILEEHGAELTYFSLKHELKMLCKWLKEGWCRSKQD